MGKVYKPNREYIGKTKSKLSGGDWWQPQKGEKSMFRVLPPWDDRGICIVRRVLHYGFETEGRKRAYPCLSDNEPWLQKKPCVVCHVSNKMLEGDKDEREAGDAIKASSAKFVVQGVDVNKPQNGVQKWAAPLSFGKYFISLLEDDDIENVTDPEEGFDVVIEVSGKGRGTKYDYRLRPKPTAIPYENWAEEMEDLIKLIEVKTNADLIEALEESYGSSFEIDGYTKTFSEKGSREESESETKPRRRKEKEKEEDSEPVKKDKPSKKKEITKDDLKDLSKRQLIKLIEEQELEIGDEDWETIEELRDVIADEMDLEE